MLKDDLKKFTEPMIIVEKPIRNHRGTIGHTRLLVVKKVAEENIDAWDKYLSLMDQGKTAEAELIVKSFAWRGVRISKDQTAELGIVEYKQPEHV